MTGRCRGWMPALTIVAVVSAAGSSQAQDLRRDTISDGVLVGAGTGAAAGAVLGLVTEDICHPAACAYLGSVVGGLIGLLVDKTNGDSHPVAPGALIDDGLGNGALIGAVGGAGMVLLDFSRGCGPEQNRSVCTRKGVILETLLGARWMAIVGLLIDAAIPSRVPRPGNGPFWRSQLERPQRRLAVGFNVRF